VSQFSGKIDVLGSNGGSVECQDAQGAQDAQDAQKRESFLLSILFFSRFFIY
jgi:hypothetical protein